MGSPLEGDRRPVPVLQTELEEAGGTFSPDGQWMAYFAAEPAQKITAPLWNTPHRDHWAIYVMPFRPGIGRAQQPLQETWAISTENGHYPYWGRDGKELFYLHRDQTMMAVPVKTGISNGQSTFGSAIPKPLFDVPAYGLRSFAVSADSQRFLVNTKVGEERSPSVTVILNWTALVKQAGNK
jgi:hypothetical protein